MQAQPVSIRQRHRAAACLAQGQAAAHDAAPDDASRHTVGAMDSEPPESASLHRADATHAVLRDPKASTVQRETPPPSLPLEGGRGLLPPEGGKGLVLRTIIALMPGRKATSDYDPTKLAERKMHLDSAHCLLQEQRQWLPRLLLEKHQLRERRQTKTSEGVPSASTEQRKPKRGVVRDCIQLPMGNGLVIFWLKTR